MAIAIPAAVMTVLFPMLISLGSKMVREILSEGLRKAYQAALDSVNPWDNILIRGLAILCNVSLDGLVKTNPNAVDPPAAIADPIINGFSQVFGRPFDQDPGYGA